MRSCARSMSLHRPRRRGHFPRRTLRHRCSFCSKRLLAARQRSSCRVSCARALSRGRAPSCRSRLRIWTSTSRWRRRCLASSHPRTMGVDAGRSRTRLKRPRTLPPRPRSRRRRPKLRRSRPSSRPSVRTSRAACAPQPRGRSTGHRTIATVSGRQCGHVRGGRCLDRPAAVWR